MTVAELRTEAGRMSRNDRAILVSELLEDLGRPEYDVSDEEVASRVEELENGSVEEISHGELLRRLGRSSAS
ncbi:MAG: hypothetical protein AAGA58_19810 [Verrucomicrobiota bacterium]